MQFFWDIVANHRRGLRVVLWQAFGHFDDAQQISGFGGLVFQCLWDEDGDTRGAWVEVNRIASVLDFGIAVVIVEIKLAWNGFQCLDDDLFGDADDESFFIHLSAGFGKILASAFCTLMPGLSIS